LALGIAGTAAAQRTASAQPAPGQGREQAADGDGLPSRGAPTGRTGAATRDTRGAGGELTLDLVAPLRGVGLTATDQPELCYVSSGRAIESMRLAISVPGQVRPLARLDLRSQPPGLGVIRLRNHGIRLPANLLCVWSLTVVLDPRAPSHDLVATALIQYRPGNPVLAAAGRDAPVEQRVAALVRAGYWYDAVALAEQARGSDHGAALASLFKQADLPTVSGT
jgi:hypothetical protein